MFRTTLRRLGLVAALSAAGLAFCAAAASAHVTVNPGQAPKGGYAALTFRVPNESDSATTTKLEVVFDDKTPIPSARVKPIAGWDAQVTTHKLAKPVTVEGSQIKEAVDRITWTAQDDAAATKPDQFQEFEISAGPLPDAKQVVFKALQTYSDGSTVRWIDPWKGSEEPEHPAPVLVLTKAEPEGPPTATTSTATAANDSSNDGKTAKTWSIVAIALSAAALAMSILRNRRSSKTDRAVPKNADK